VGTDKYHIQVCHHLRGESASNEYDQYVVYLIILNHDVTDMFSIYRVVFMILDDIYDLLLCMMGLQQQCDSATIIILFCNNNNNKNNNNNNNNKYLLIYVSSDKKSTSDLLDVQRRTMQQKEHSQVNYSSIESLDQDGRKCC